MIGRSKNSNHVNFNETLLRKHLVTLAHVVPCDVIDLKSRDPIRSAAAADDDDDDP